MSGLKVKCISDRMGGAQEFTDSWLEEEGGSLHGKVGAQEFTDSWLEEEGGSLHGKVGAQSWKLCGDL